MGTLDRKLYIGGELCVADTVTVDRALEVIASGDQHFEAHVSKFTQLRVHVCTPTFCSRTEYTGHVFDLYQLVLSLRHRSKPEPKNGPTSRTVAAAMLEHH